MELNAELVGRDGSSRPFRVTCEGSLRGILSGLERLQGDVSMELTQLVDLEKGAGAAQRPDNEDYDDDDDDDDDDNSKNCPNNGTLCSSPPAKRKKILHQ